MPARLRVLRRVGQEVRDHLRQARLVGFQASPARRSLNIEVMAPLLEQRASDLRRLGEDVADLHRLLAQLHLAAGDPRDVEQVVHQPDEVPGLALDHFLLAQDPAVAAQLHQLERGEDRRERIAQLVAEHRQELVLGGAGSLRLLPRVPQRLLELVAALELGLQRPRALLQEADLEQALVAAVRLRIALGRSHVIVRLADPGEVLGVDFLEEVPHPVSAEQREGLETAEIVPELLQSNRRLGKPVAPEHVDHLAVQADPLALAGSQAIVDDRPDARPEQLPLGHSLDHEPGQGRARIEEGQPALGARALHVEAFLAQ